MNNQPTQYGAIPPAVSQPKILLAIDCLECNITDVVNRISNLEDKLALVLNGRMGEEKAQDAPRQLNPCPLADRIEQCSNKLFKAEESLRSIISRVEV